MHQAYYEVPVEKCTSIELNEAKNIMTSVPGCTRSKTFSAALPATRVSSCMRKPVVSNIVRMHVPRPMRTMPGVCTHTEHAVCVCEWWVQAHACGKRVECATHVCKKSAGCMHACRINAMLRARCSKHEHVGVCAPDDNVFVATVC